MVLAMVSVVTADAANQSDWSGGEVDTGTVSAWDGTFAEAEGISWLAVPGQITLSGVDLETASQPCHR